MRHGKRGQVARYQRFTMDCKVSVIVKNVRSRCACFWFGLSNVSASGVGLEYYGYGHIPFSIGDVITLTIDTSSAIFKRPIHLKAVIRRREESSVEVGENPMVRVFLGAEILSVDSLHQSVWIEGLTSMGDPYKMDSYVEGKKDVA